MTVFSFYCPACGESSPQEWETYELAPDDERLQCPNCGQWFIVSHEYVPTDAAPAGTKPWLKLGDEIPF